jgi:hypothetical protein
MALHDKKMAEKRQKGIDKENDRREAEAKKKVEDRKNRYAGMRQNLFSSGAGGFDTNSAQSSGQQMQ